MLKLGENGFTPKQDIESPNWSRFITILGRLGQLFFKILLTRLVGSWLFLFGLAV
ncbi:hypothetical protein TGAM01_v209497 [Trichoderma gamsii]|uniref:Uncharacterized protein n=1 Tax=Trichoderma gamsii TaxID=398673 RepID=A0A2P4ZBD4_9HYPO|nr:hypothetical protein TGAM01_v209497 [Trichoderma gamsii]PON21608.1 hypothetical protein TGAM01_v209497 [Trichoderma gamsii]